MRVGDLFAGIGGFSLGLEWAGMETVWQVERDEFCNQVLRKHWPSVTRYGDIHDFIEEAELGAVKSVDLIAGGPPCQPASVAGKRQGAKDDRWLWPETLRAVAALRPAWCLFENPLGFRSMGLDDLLSDLESLEYAVQALDIPAAGVGADHIRHRLWILAHNDSGCGERGPVEEICSGWDTFEPCIQLLSHPDSARYSAWGESGANITDVGNECEGSRSSEFAEIQRARGWRHQPLLGRGVHGIPRRVDRLRALGNAVIPQIPYVIGKAIMEAERAD
jgi:DNA (cytosine-5)-methyltransferase 1